MTRKGKEIPDVVWERFQESAEDANVVLVWEKVWGPWFDMFLMGWIAALKVEQSGK